MNDLIDRIDACIQFAEEKREQNHELILHINELIEENYMNYNFTTNDIAAQNGYSLAYLSRVYKSLTNESISEKLLNVRLQHAADLLKNSDLSTKDIFIGCGFVNSSYFAALFKKNSA